MGTITENTPLAAETARQETRLAWLALEDLPSQVLLELDSDDRCESGSLVTASLMPDTVLRRQEAMVLETLLQDTSLQIDGILEALETQLTSSEVFTTIFEFEMAGSIRQLPGKKHVRTMS